MTLLVRLAAFTYCTTVTCLALVFLHHHGVIG